MMTALYASFFILGSIIGSFLNALLFRLGTGFSMQGRSMCTSCGRELLWFELIPVASFIVLGGSCRTCKSRISARYPLVELFLGVLFTASVVVFGATLQTLALLGVFSLLVAVVAYDIRHLIVPDVLLAPLALFAVLYAFFSFLDGGFSFRLFLSHGAAALGGFLFFALLWFVSRGSWMGFGDAKLAAVLGISLTSIEMFSVVVAAFWIGATVGIAMLLSGYVMSRRMVTLKSKVPFAPFLALGYALVVFTEFSVLTVF